MSAAGVSFAVVFAALYAAHQVGDHWVQTGRQAAGKATAGWPGRLACARHVATLTAVKAAAVALAVTVTGLRRGALAVAIGLALDAASHYWADRRITLRGLASVLAKSEFYVLGATRDGHDGAPHLGAGAYALDLLCSNVATGSRCIFSNSITCGERAQDRTLGLRGADDLVPHRLVEPSVGTPPRRQRASLGIGNSVLRRSQMLLSSSNHLRPGDQEECVRDGAPFPPGVPNLLQDVRMDPCRALFTIGDNLTLKLPELMHEAIPSRPVGGIAFTSFLAKPPNVVVAKLPLRRLSLPAMGQDCRREPDDASNQHPTESTSECKPGACATCSVGSGDRVGHQSDHEILPIASHGLGPIVPLLRAVRALRPTATSLAPRPRRARGQPSHPSGPNAPQRTLPISTRRKIPHASATKRHRHAQIVQSTEQSWHVAWLFAAALIASIGAT